MSAIATEWRYHTELIDGREVEKHTPKKLHATIQKYLLLLLSRELPAEYEVLPELDVLTGGITAAGRREHIVPDLVIVKREASYTDGQLADAPLLGVEILSPGQTIDQVFVRAARILNLGTPIAWAIWPERRRAWEYGLADLVEQQEALHFSFPDGGQTLSIPLNEIWAELDKSVVKDGAVDRD